VGRLRARPPDEGNRAAISVPGPSLSLGPPESGLRRARAGRQVGCRWAGKHKKKTQFRTGWNGGARGASNFNGGDFEMAHSPSMGGQCVAVGTKKPVKRGFSCGGGKKIKPFLVERGMSYSLPYPLFLSFLMILLHLKARARVPQPGSVQKKQTPGGRGSGPGSAQKKSGLKKNPGPNGGPSAG